MFFRYSLFILILIIFLSPALAVSRMGATPVNHKVVYNGQDVIKGDVTFTPYGDKNLRIIVQGELEDYLTLDGHPFEEGKPKEYTLHTSRPFTVDYTFRPPKDLLPGDYKTRIRCVQYFTPEEELSDSFSGARGIVAYSFLVILRVPNEGKFLEATMKLDPEQPKTGEIVFFNIDLLNLGTEELNNLYTTLSIKDPNEKIVVNKDTTKVNKLIPSATGQIRAFVDTREYSSGWYTVDGKIEYGGQGPAELFKKFKIGDIFIKIIDMSVDLNSSVGKFFIDIESNWNEPITDVYAKIVIKKGDTVIDSIKTSSLTIDSWGTATLEGYWEKNDLELGDYDAEVTVYYYDKYAQQQMSVKLEGEEEKEVEEKQVSIAESSALLFIIVVLLLIIVIVNLWWFMHSKNKNNKKPKKKRK